MRIQSNFNFECVYLWAEIYALQFYVLLIDNYVFSFEFSLIDKSDPNA